MKREEIFHWSSVPCLKRLGVKTDENAREGKTPKSRILVYGDPSRSWGKRASGTEKDLEREWRRKSVLSGGELKESSIETGAVENRVYVEVFSRGRRGGGEGFLEQEKGGGRTHRRR